MKKVLATILVFVLLTMSFTGCADRKTINNTEYDTYGLFDQSKKENPNIEYDLVNGNIVWSVILSETIIAPIYFLGFALWEPVGPRVTNPNERGVVGGNKQTYDKVIYEK